MECFHNNLIGFWLIKQASIRSKFLAYDSRCRYTELEGRKKQIGKSLNAGDGTPVKRKAFVHTEAGG